MAINKVIDRNNNVLIDLSYDTVTSDKVLSGETFHGADGVSYIGTLPRESMSNRNKYTFYDYNGTLLYSYTDDELDALTELPAGPDHTNENLTFQSWNWTLEELKNVDRTRSDRPIVGPFLKTTDGITYMEIFPTSASSNELKINLILDFRDGNQNYSFEKDEDKGIREIEVDWGDGEIETITSSSETSGSKSVTHTYPSYKKYLIKLNNKTPQFRVTIDGQEGTLVTGSGAGVIYNVKHGNVFVQNISYYTMAFDRLNIPEDNIVIPRDYTCLRELTLSKNTKLTFAYLQSGMFTSVNRETFSAKIISLPNTGTRGYSRIESTGFKNFDRIYISEDFENSIEDTAHIKISFSYFSDTEIPNLKRADMTISYGQNVETLSIPFTKSTTNNSISYMSNIKNISFGEGYTTFNPTSIGSGNQSLKYIKLPSTITSLTSYTSNISGAPIGCILDASDISEMLSVTSNPSAIFSLCSFMVVKDELLDSYKAASYWSNYSKKIIGKGESGL